MPKKERIYRNVNNRYCCRRHHFKAASFNIQTMHMHICMSLLKHEDDKNDTLPPVETNFLCKRKYEKKNLSTPIWITRNFNTFVVYKYYTYYVSRTKLEAKWDLKMQWMNWFRIHFVLFSVICCCWWWFRVHFKYFFFFCITYSEFVALNKSFLTL